MEWIVSLIIGILGLIFREYQTNKQKESESVSTKINEAREALSKADASGISAVLDDQHVRVYQALLDSGFPIDSNHNQGGDRQPLQR